jgi:hypothetical protein
MRLPKKPQSLKDLPEFCNAVIEYLRMVKIGNVVGGRVSQTTSGTTITINPPPTAGYERTLLVPFLTLIRESIDEEDNQVFLLSMVEGYIITRSNKGDAAGLLVVDNIPNGLEVEDGDKIYCKIEEDEKGNAVSATIEKDVDWPESVAPELEGGGAEGYGGYRYIRIAEVVLPEGERLKTNQLLTGHIDHFQPTLIDNKNNETSVNEARVLKGWDVEDGKWKLRNIIGDDGIEVEENENDITIKGGGGFTHPWKVTPNGTAFVTVAPGNVTGFLPKSDLGTPAWKPRFFSPFVGTYIKFPGDVVEVTESSGYIYMGFTLESEVEGSEGGMSGGGDLIANIYRPYTEPVVFFYSLSPENLDSIDFSSAYDVIIPIAEVSLADDIASVDYQILTHNPMIQLDDIEYPYEPE